MKLAITSESTVCGSSAAQQRRAERATRLAEKAQAIQLYIAARCDHRAAPSFSTLRQLWQTRDRVQDLQWSTMATE